jgi:oxygen-dependent protoporphyrinogen oxidase
LPRTIVLGGGISGLSTAHFLLRGDPSLELLLLESGPRLGGTLGSERIDGFVLERGPSGFMDNVTETLEQVEELGLKPRLLKASAETSRRYIYRSGRLLPVPQSPWSFLRSPLLSLRGRMNLLAEPLRRSAGEKEDSVASFGRRRLGEEATRVFLDPLVSGVYGGDVERLSLPAAFPRLAEMEARHGSIFKAMLHLYRERARAGRARSSEGSLPADGRGPDHGEAGPPSSTFQGTLFSFPEGLEELVQALGTRLGPRVRLSWPVSQVQKEGKRFVVVGPGGARETADSVVVALPTHRAATILAAAATGLSLSLEAIPYSPIAAVCLGFPREAVAHPLDGFGFLVPRDQGLRILGAIWVSSIYPAHAPPGLVSLRCLVGGARDPDSIDRSDEALLLMVLDELRPILGLRDGPAVKRVYRYAKGIPQYNLGHQRRVEAIERELWSLPGLFLTGNAYRGVGVNDCVREARRKARAVLEHLRR